MLACGHSLCIAVWELLVCDPPSSLLLDLNSCEDAGRRLQSRRLKLILSEGRRHEFEGRPVGCQLERWHASSPM